MKDRGWLVLTVAAMGMLALPFLRDQFGFPVFYLVFLSGVLFWTAQATSWNILSGYSGYFSFGQGAFFGVGVYSVAFFFARRGLSWWVGVLLGGLLSMLLALILGTIAFRLRQLRGEIFALLTLAIPFILAAVVRLSRTIDGGQGVGIPVPSYPDMIGPFQHFYFVLSALVALIALALAYGMQRTRYGWALFAIHDDEQVAEGLGVPTFRYKMIAIAVTGLLGGLSGAVFALNLGHVSPEGTFNLRVPLFAIVMSALGGRRHWAGPMVGALYIYTLQNRLSAAGFEGWSLIVLGAILISLILFAPDGLMSRFTRRPWTVTAVLVGVLVAMTALGTGLIIDRLAVALLVAAVTAFLPRRATADTRPPETARGLSGLEQDPGGDEARPPELGRPLVSVADVTKSFGGVRALAGVSITVSEGELVGLVGPNGSGKTTLVNVISGTLRPTSGSITVAGFDIAGLQPHRISHLGLARTYQIPRPFPTLTVRDNVAIAIMFGREPRGLYLSREAADEHLAMVGLAELAHAYPPGINLHERQLLEMARAIATRPKVLLLDEALAGLNPVEIDNAVAVVRRIHRSGVAIVLVEHLLRVVNQLSTRIIVLDQGLLLAEGEPAEVLKDPAVVATYLGKQPHA
jgi:branched-chain amino acid transport system permease protein